MATWHSRGRSRARCVTFVYLAAAAIGFEGEISIGYDSSTISTPNDMDSSVCTYENQGNGRCDNANNLAACGAWMACLGQEPFRCARSPGVSIPPADYDGGDCCACTCEDSDGFTCGSNHFNCQDPSASCYESSGNKSDSCYSSGNGWCDTFNNNAVCDYDGGDCCSCTCVDDTYSCGLSGFDCQDPNTSCNGSSAPPRECSGFVFVATIHFERPGASRVTSLPPRRRSSARCGLYAVAGADTSDCYASADGWCDSSINNAACDYDGGDCCPCTCDEDASFTCGTYGYDCKDPSAYCYESSGDTTLEMSGGPTGLVDETGDPGMSEYPTLIPNDDTMDSDLEVDYPACTTGIIAQIGDGTCNTLNNNMECGYDGGDCCSCTCDDPTTGAACNTTYDCQDTTSSCYDSDAASSGPSSSASSFNGALYIALGAGGATIAVVVTIVLCLVCACKKRGAVFSAPVTNASRMHPPDASGPPMGLEFEMSVTTAPLPSGNNPHGHNGTVTKVEQDLKNMLTLAPIS